MDPWIRVPKKARHWRRRPRKPKPKNERKVGTPKRKPWFQPKPLGLPTGFLQLGWWVGWGFGFVGWGRFFWQLFLIGVFWNPVFFREKGSLCFVFPCFFGYFFGVKPSNNNRRFFGSGGITLVVCWFSSACSYRIMTILNHQGTPDFSFCITYKVLGFVALW